MSMTNPKLTTVATRPLSRKQIYRYFQPEPLSRWPYLLTMLGIFLLIAAGLVRYWPLILLSFVPLMIGSTFVYHGMKVNPDDTAFDAWLESEARELYTRGLHALGLSRQDLVNPPLRIASYVLPGSRTAEEYPERQVLVKRGKDGRLRFSITVYTYLYLTDDYLAIYQGDVNICTSRHNELHETYLYQHIYNATIRRIKDQLVWEGTTSAYRTELFCLKISNGETVDLSAAIKTMPQDPLHALPIDDLPNPNFDRTLNKLRQLLHARNKDA